MWSSSVTNATGFRLSATLESHECSVNCLAVSKGTHLVASGSADGTIKIWRLRNEENDVSAEQVQTVQTNPRFFPLALALHRLNTAGDLILAVAGTRNIVQIYVASPSTDFCHQSTLPGHEGWIRSLSITPEKDLEDSDLLLASASQDRCIRLWRMTRAKPNKQLEEVGAFEQSLSNKIHRLETSESNYKLTFEALLLGHEDWIYTVSWRLDGGRLQLLSASADNSIAIWESDHSSGVWVCTTRLGEISAQKGSTTATGSTGGFNIGLWSPSGRDLVCLGRTGSWRLWNYDRYHARWLQGVGISGHTKSVTDAAWSRNGSYLLSTGSDQTTRLHAEWNRGTKRSWHELARPQIHGYDINCIDSISQMQFISGADEKLLRVFDEPQATADLLERLCDICTDSHQKLPTAANVPVLGLSNKATENGAGKGVSNVEGNAEQSPTPASASPVQAPGPNSPPFEDQLARHTLWPEREKLYGHGYEISAVTASHDGSLVATSCRASSLDHAVIRLYTTKNWREIRPSLTAHSLTVTALIFSTDDGYLLSVGRDRQWTVFERNANHSEEYLLKYSNSKGHSRMILDACWGPVEAGRIFATASRDKTVKIWSVRAIGVDCVLTMTASSPVTAVDIFPRLLHDGLVVVIGTEKGNITLHIVQPSNWAVKESYELVTW